MSEQNESEFLDLCHHFAELLMPFFAILRNALFENFIEYEFDQPKLFEIVKNTTKLLKFRKSKKYITVLILIKGNEVTVTDTLQNKEITHKSKTGYFLFSQDSEMLKSLKFSTNYEKTAIKMPHRYTSNADLDIESLAQISQKIIFYNKKDMLSINEIDSFISKNFTKIDIKVPALMDCLTSPLIIPISTNLKNPEMKYQGDDRISIKFDGKIMIIVSVSNLFNGINLLEGNIRINGINIPLCFEINKVESEIYLFSKNNRFIIGDNGIPKFVNRTITRSEEIKIETLDSQFNPFYRKIVIYGDNNKYIMKKGNLYIKDNFDNAATVYFSKNFYTNLYFDFNLERNAIIQFINPLTNELEYIPNNLYSGSLKFEYKFKVNSPVKPEIFPSRKLIIIEESFSNGILKFSLKQQRYPMADTYIVIVLKTETNKSFSFRIPVLMADGKITVDDNLLSFKWCDEHLNNYESYYYVEKTNEWKKIEPEKPIEIEQNKYIIVSPFTYIWVSLNEPNIDCIIEPRSLRMFPYQVRNAAFFVLDSNTKEPKIVHIDDFDPNQMICIVGRLCDSIEDISKHPKKYEHAWIPSPNKIVETELRMKTFDEAYTIIDSILSFIGEPKKTLEEIKSRNDKDSDNLINYIIKFFKHRLEIISHINYKLALPCKIIYLLREHSLILKNYKKEVSQNEINIVAKTDEKPIELPNKSFEVLKLTRSTIEGLMMSDLQKPSEQLICDFGTNKNIFSTNFIIYPRAEFNEQNIKVVDQSASTHPEHHQSTSIDQDTNVLDIITNEEEELFEESNSSSEDDFESYYL